MDMVTQVQILDIAVFISHSANSLGKGMNPTILPPTQEKIVKFTGLLSFSMTTCLEEKL